MVILYIEKQEPGLLESRRARNPVSSQQRSAPPAAFDNQAKEGCGGPEAASAMEGGCGGPAAAAASGGGRAKEGVGGGPAASSASGGGRAKEGGGGGPAAAAASDGGRAKEGVGGGLAAAEAGGSRRAKEDSGGGPVAAAAGVGGKTREGGAEGPAAAQAEVGKGKKKKRHFNRRSTPACEKCKKARKRCDHNLSASRPQQNGPLTFGIPHTKDSEKCALCLERKAAVCLQKLSTTFCQRNHHEWLKSNN